MTARRGAGRRGDEERRGGLDAPETAESRRILAELAALHRAGTVSALPFLAASGLAYRAGRRGRAAEMGPCRPASVPTDFPERS